MHVVLVSRESYPLDLEGEAGGIGRYTEMTATALAKLGARVTVVSQHPAKEFAEKKRDGVLVVYLPKWEDVVPWSWRLRATEQALLNTRLGASLWADVASKRRRAAIVSRYLAGLDARGQQPDIIEFPECGAEGYYFVRRNRRPVCVTRIHGPTQMLRELNGLSATPSLRLLM